MKQNQNDIETMGLMMLAGENPTNMLMNKEKQGQSWLVQQVKLPREGGIEILNSLGITFTETPNDELFYDCILPEGWKIEPTDHHMWSNLVDVDGVKRLDIFYKAAFYDRSAFFRLSPKETT